MTTLENIKNQANEALALAGKAEEGKWFTSYSEGCTPGDSCKSIWTTIDGGTRIGNCVLTPTANFIAASRTIVPQQAETILKLVRALDLVQEWAIAGNIDNFGQLDDKIEAILSGGK